MYHLSQITFESFGIFSLICLNMSSGQLQFVLLVSLMVDLLFGNLYKLNAYCFGCNASLPTIFMDNSPLFIQIYVINFIILLSRYMGLSSFACKIMYYLDYGCSDKHVFGYSFYVVICVLARRICNVSIVSFLTSSYQNEP